MITKQIKPKRINSTQLSIHLAKIIFTNLFYYSNYFCYNSLKKKKKNLFLLLFMRLLHFLTLFMGS